MHVSLDKCPGKKNGRRQRAQVTWTLVGGGAGGRAQGEEVGRRELGTEGGGDAGIHTQINQACSQTVRCAKWGYNA